jgi:transposase InsO family protein
MASVFHHRRTNEEDHKQRFWREVVAIVRRMRQWWRRWRGAGRRPRFRPILVDRPSPRHPIQPKPKWVKHEVIRLKALMPQAGCRTIAHAFNRRWRARRQMTVSKTYVADTCRHHQYLIYDARRKLKHRVPRSMPRNRIWGCDLLTQTDHHGTPHLALALVDHASRACLRLQRLTDKSSWTLVQELIQAVKCYGRPQFIRTDNEAVFVSRLFRFGLWLLGIRQQRIDPGCPWQNGRVERLIGTVKRELARTPIANGKEFDTTLRNVRCWYNHDRPHDHLQGRTPAEVWAGIDIFAPRRRPETGTHNGATRKESG